jgi:CheY-like chemotaxis protein/signal transduction histidine kinase/HAMP domain-containing protein
MAETSPVDECGGAELRGVAAGTGKAKSRRVSDRESLVAEPITPEPSARRRGGGGGGSDGDPLHELLTALRALEAGEFSVRLAPARAGSDPVLLEIADAFNGIAARNERLTREVVRVSTTVGREGKMTDRASIPEARGGWALKIDSINSLISDLMQPTTEVSRVLTAVAQGDLSRKMVLEIDGKSVQGEFLRIGTTVNTMVDQLSAFASEVTRVAREVGTEGKLGGQASVPGVAGTWKDLTDNVNSMGRNLTDQVRNIALVTTAVANGDLSQKITVDARGEVLELKNTINTMVDQLSSFASEVTRVAGEVGTEGELGGQAEVPGVAGTWKDLTDNVNAMGRNLTDQVRNIALVTTAVANGDLSRKITVDARGEILELKDTVNTMVDRLGVFANEVTRVAREVGTEGKLGGQAAVPGAEGTWRALTDNVNAMANNLTVQVRAIADVATAVTKGDLTRMIMVEAQGELAELKANINQMITNLKETTEKNMEQDWLKTNLAKFSRMMQGQKNLEAVSQLIMSELTPLVSASQGVFYIMENEGEEGFLKLIASYAYKHRKHVSNRFHLGEGVVGQAALEKKPIVLMNVPEDYIQIVSGLGESPARNILVLPVLFEGKVKAVIELGSFLPFSQIHQLFLDQLGESLGVVLNMITANMRTEELLQQSQSLTQELQSQSEELKHQQGELKRSNAELEAQAQTLKASEEMLKEQREELQQVNEELEEKAALLAEQNKKVEQKNREVELARRALEEKAEQLELTSKYKSEFLANMSHELRTPLNSLLILARQLSKNLDGNLTSKQVEFAETILGSGTDLLNLINDILDLTKVEAGKMQLYLGDVAIADLLGFAERTFRPVAEEKGLGLSLVSEPEVPPLIFTDGQRLQQILKNLLANAFKFTDRGQVELRVSVARGRRFASRRLDRAGTVLAFDVRDTGIGIPADKRRLIFEAFQQVDGTPSRKYDGTGLGLSISREITWLLGGEIHLVSTVGAGSSFTLYLPLSYEPPVDQRATGPGPTLSWRTSTPAHGAAPRTGGAVLTGTPASEPVARPLLGEGAWLAEPEAGIGPNPLGDDRERIEPGDPVVLIIENDESFAGILLDLAREKTFRALVALNGETGLRLAHRYKPDAITLDINLPVLDGWAVLENLKSHPDTRHIPVHIVSIVEKRQRGLRLGALSYLEKPVTKEALEGAFDRIRSYMDQRVKSLLVVEDDEAQRRSIVELIADEDVTITAVATAEEALHELEAQHVDCMVLDLGLGEASAFRLLERIKGDAGLHDLPVIIYSGEELTPAEEAGLRRYAETIVIKDVRSPERLLDETALFLHRVEARLPEQKRRLLEQLHAADSVFNGKQVLIVDDDVRNIFALTSVLEEYGMNLAFAENGRDALARLREPPNTDIVLMDVMMPELDGYETMRRIRSDPRLQGLPIIALTAQAMKGDREKCLAAGASDYITKPVNVDQLISLMRVWLYQ